MLTGLKKSKAQSDHKDSSKQKQQTIVSGHMLKQEVLREQQIAQLSIPDNKNNLRSYQHCMELFLNGNTKDLQRQLQQFVKTTTTVEKPGKFQYNLDFGEEKQKQELKKRNRPIMASNRISQYCPFCPDNQQLLLLSASNYVYLALPQVKTFRNYFHLILAPVDHEQTIIGLNPDILTEIQNYQKCLIQAFDKINLQAIFFQQFSKQNSHIYIQCLALPYPKAEDLPFFFKQGLEDCEGNWATHKNIIKIEKSKGGIQKQIPKPIKYLYIDFGQGYGYAHVIENQKFWRRQLVHEIMATAIGLQQHSVKTSQEYSSEQKDTKRDNFNKIWSQFDWTKLI